MTVKIVMAMRVMTMMVEVLKMTMAMTKIVMILNSYDDGAVGCNNDNTYQ